MTTSEPGGARAAVPERLAEAERRLTEARDCLPDNRTAVIRKGDLRALLAEYDRRGAALASVLTALNAGSDEDPVSAARFVREAADAFVARIAPLEVEVQRLRARLAAVRTNGAFQA